MWFEIGEVDGFLCDAGRGSGFESAEFEAEVFEGGGHAAGGWFVDASALGFFFAGVHEGAEEGAGGDDNGAAGKLDAGFEGKFGTQFESRFDTLGNAIVIALLSATATLVAAVLGVLLSGPRAH